MSDQEMFKKCKDEKGSHIIRILVVEDNEVNQRVMEEFLFKMGYSADIVINGKEALEVLETFSYDLIFMDVQMPELDGFETTRNIRNWKDSDNPLHRALAQIPIVAITAHALKEDRQRCIAAGMNYYIPKPFTQAEIGNVINSALGIRGSQTRNIQK